MRTSRKDGLTPTLMTSRTPRASTGHSSGCRSTRTARVGDSGMGISFRVGLAGEDLEDAAYAHVVVAALVDLATVAHDHEAVAQAQVLLQLGGDEDDRQALGGELG